MPLTLSTQRLLNVSGQIVTSKEFKLKKNLYNRLSLFVGVSNYHHHEDEQIKHQSDMSVFVCVVLHALLSTILFCFSAYLAENTLCKHGVSATRSAVSSASAHTSQRTHPVTMAPLAI
jgi:hypothetical protein